MRNGLPKLESLLPESVRARIEPPDRARNEKITARFTDEEYELLARFAGERRETVTAVVRKLALATIDATSAGLATAKRR